MDNGLFETIFEPDFLFLYKSIFGEDTPNLIDIDLRFKYGNRELVGAITNETAMILLKVSLQLSLTNGKNRFKCLITNMMC